MTEPIFSQSNFDTETTTATIAAAGSLTATMTVKRFFSAAASASTSMNTAVRTRRRIAASASCVSYVTATANIESGPPAVVRTVGFDRSNLTGTYAIVMPRFGQRRFRYIEIDFTYGGTTYHKAYYTEKEIDIAMTDVYREPAASQTVLLDNFEGTIAWKK